MKAYITDFLKEYEYSLADAQHLIAVYEKIESDPEAKKLWDEALALYDTDINCDYSKVISLADTVAKRLYIHEYTAELLVFICLSKKTREVYRERGLDESIYKNTMLDLKYKMDECKLVKGIIGSFVAFWFAGFFKLTRFALGRLQFEIVDFKENYENNGKILTPESKVINVHIPRSLTPLDKESCDAAYAQAKEFFKDEIDENCAFVCHSWLLYPENKNIIPSHTNIYRFMSEFDIISSDITKDNSDLWRLFDTDEKHPDKLPTDTSVRRNYVEHLRRGGKTGWGYGVFFAK